MEHAIISASGSEVDFMIHGLFSYELLGQTFWITTSHVCILLVMLILTGFALAVNIKMRHGEEVPGTLQNIGELIVEKLDGMVYTTMGRRGKGFTNYMGTVFLFVLVSNISAVFGLRPPTADYGTTLPLGLITFFLIHITRFRYQKPGEIWKDMCSPLPAWLPIWVPINLISEIAVPISLSLRLFANVLSGTVIMTLVYALLQKAAYIWPAVLHAYFDLFSGAVQTYVFCMLTMTYIGNAMGDEE